MILVADTKLKFEPWSLKDKNGIAFEFDQSFQKPVFIFFFASWDMRSQAALHMIDEFYEKFHTQIDFYIVSNEEREPVVAYFEENDFGLIVLVRSSWGGGWRSTPKVVSIADPEPTPEPESEPTEPKDDE